MGIVHITCIGMRIFLHAILMKSLHFLIRLSDLAYLSTYMYTFSMCSGLYLAHYIISFSSSTPSSFLFLLSMHVHVHVHVLNDITCTFQLTCGSNYCHSLSMS